MTVEARPATWRASAQKSLSGKPAAAKPVPGWRRTMPRLARSTLHEDAYQAIRDALMTGRFQPGEQLTLRDLAQSLGTSMMPVRDAVGRLVAEGALTMLPNRSAALPAMTRDRLRQLYRVRLALDGMLVGDAAERITPRDLKTLQGLIERMEADRKSADVARFLEHNQAFHFTIYQAAGEAILCRMMETNWLQIGPFIHHSLDQRGMAIGSKHHRAALAALARGDGEAARQAMAQDIIDASENIMRRLPEPAEAERNTAAGSS
jgi:DNA-binding GntR family transcriptional regulator